MSSEYGEFINIDNLHYAQIVDTLAAYTPGANKYLAPAGEISHEPSVNMKTRYYDGVPMFTSNTEGETKVAITVSGVPSKLAAELTGKYYDPTKGIVIDTGDASKAPWCAFSGRMELGDGGFKHFQYLKGKFSLGKASAKSKTDDIDAQTYELTYTAVTTVHTWSVNGEQKGVKAVQGDTTDPAFNATNWFNQVQTPDTVGTVIAAIALSSSNPTANATGVATTVKPTLTFNNQISNYSDIVLFNQTDGVLVANTITADAAGKILTITPTAALVSAKVYQIILAGVTDIYGQVLADTTVKFTVA